MPEDTLIGTAATLAEYLAARLAAVGRPVDEYGADLQTPVVLEGEGCGSLLTVHVGTIIPAPDQGRRVSVPFHITITRCTGYAEKMSAADRESATVDVLQDVWLLWNALTEGHAEETLFEWCNDVNMINAIPIENQGGVGGYRIEVDVHFDAYNPKAAETP